MFSRSEKPLSDTSITDINTLSEFLSHSRIQDLSAHDDVDAIVICVSAVFLPAETLFKVLEKRPDLTKCLVLCGGLGHSTALIYEAVARHSIYQSLAQDVKGLPEARVLEKILSRFFDVDTITSKGCKILIEDKSTNCSENAIESRKVLESSGMISPETIILTQDPTMQIRTAASFEHVFSNSISPVKVLSCPILVPRMKLLEAGQVFNVPGVEDEDLWEQSRFFDLIMGEIPRLKLYGPQGKGSIVHVDVPVEVEEAFARLEVVLNSKR